jgi:hypothetical protein
MERVAEAEEREQLVKRRHRQMAEMAATDLLTYYELARMKLVQGAEEEEEILEAAYPLDLAARAEAETETLVVEMLLQEQSTQARVAER